MIKINRSNYNWKNFKDVFLNWLSKLSKAFMLPIAILPMAGLLLGIGGAIGANTESSGAQDFANYLKGMSGVIFGNLPILFGASVAMSFTNVNKISAVFMMLVAYFVFNGVQNAFIHYEKDVFKDVFYFHTNDSIKYMITKNLGITSLRTSIFGGIIIGSLTSYIMNRYSEIQLPTALSFFSGIRLVPMILIPITSIISIAFLIIWPYVGTLIAAIGNTSSTAPAGLDGLIYGMLGRSLMPFGLHHIVIGMAWQSSLGGSLAQNDVISAATKLGVQDSFEIQKIIEQMKQSNITTIVGDQNIWNFINGLPINRLPINNHGGSLPIFEWFTKYTGVYPGRFQQDYPIYIGACIGIGLAIVLASDKDKRRKTMTITGSAMAVAFLTGITEPLEFSFLFVAPLFYFGIYVPLSGLAYMLMKISRAHIGVGFARGFIDLIIYGAVPVQKGTKFWWAFVYAGGFGIISFITFYFMIKKFNYQTPGRGNNDIALINKKKYNELKNQKQKNDEILKLVSAYGGASNLQVVTACATRLRITVYDQTKIDSNLVKQLGALGFIEKGKSSQAIFGGKASILANKINEEFKNEINAKNKR